jgi:hypothetical protein
MNINSIAIMQPYFYPYLNYYNLFKFSDLVLILDDVQFPRRGWVHRNKLDLINIKNKKDWLTLPIAYCKRESLINEIKFNNNSFSEFEKRSVKFNFFYKKILNYPDLKKTIFNFELSPVNYLIKNLECSCKLLRFKFKIKMASDIPGHSELRNEDKIIYLIKKLSAKYYYNLPGGEKIYNKENFENNNIKLIFLNNYTGNYNSFLDNLG